MKDNVAQIEEVVEQKITDLPNTKKAVNE